MISPGSKGWIPKYFDLIEKQKISINLEEISLDSQLIPHLIFSQSGIVFGFPSEFIFAKNLRNEKWTIEEKLTFLLFECHFYIYLSNGGSQNNQADFVEKMLDFYEHHSVISISKIFTFFLKESGIEKLEKILEKRTEIRKNLFENTFWVNYLSNTFVYLDVILFDEFLRTKKSLEISNYEKYAENALYALILAAQADGVIELKEKQLFNVFLASAKIHDKKKEEIEELLKTDISLDFLDKTGLKNNLFKRFILDISVLVVYTTLDETHAEEKNHLLNLCDYLGIDESILNETLVQVEKFVIKNNDQIAFLSDSNAVEKIYSNISKRWIKILGRNKDKLALELRQSKELVFLIKKSTSKELNKDEKEKVKTQFLDIVKTMPSLAIFLLPGGAFLLPLVLKIIPDLIPSAFRDNEIED
jgi:hypothetical protein